MSGITRIADENTFISVFYKFSLCLFNRKR